jgi:hypothetical protein
MNKTITVHNRNTFHKRDYSKEKPHKNAGIILRRQYGDKWGKAS